MIRLGGREHYENTSVPMKPVKTDQIIRDFLHDYHKFSIKSYVLDVY